MRLISSVAGLATLFCLAISPSFAATPSTPKSGHSQIVIVFKDGHRQSFNLAEIERIEFPAAAAPATASSPAAANSAQPSRGRFLGKWEVGDGNGSNFIITLKENGEAMKSIGDLHGKWEYVDGEARVSWEDGWTDVIRKVGPSFQKFAYSGGKSVTGTADNVTNARNTTPHPI
ncbi:MAG: hypothetical protein ABR991_02095 [Terracidiphilus sp.]